MLPTRGFTIREHPADVGIAAHGPTMAEAFQCTAEGMFSLLADLAQVRPLEAVEVTTRAGDRETLLVAWLNELLYHFDSNRFVFSRFDIDRCYDSEIGSRAWGEPYDPARHGVHTTIKAVTYHRLRVARNEEWETEVTFDV